MFLFYIFFYFNIQLIFRMLFFTHIVTLASPLKILYGYIKSQSYTMIDSLSINLYINAIICKLKKFGSHFTPVQRRSQKIVTGEDGNSKITAAEALKKLDEVKKFIKVNKSNHLNIIFKELIEKVEQMKLKNQKLSNIRSFFRS